MKKLKKSILISRNRKYQDTLWNLKKIKEYYKYKSLFIKKKYLKEPNLELLSIKDKNKNFITYNCLKKLYFKALKIIIKSNIKKEIRWKIKKNIQSKYQS